MSGKVRGQLAFASIHDGTDGNGVEYVYLLTDSSTPPSIVNNDPYTVTKEGQTITVTYKDDKFCPMSSTGNRCTDHPSGVSLNAKYEWVAVREKGEPNDKGEREWLPYELVPMVRWSQFGERGTDGDGMEYIFARTSGSTAPTITNDAYNNNPENYLADDFLPHIVGATTQSATDDPQGTSAQYPYEWVMVRSKGSPDENGVRHWNKYTPGTAMAQWSRFANDGNSLVFEPSVINMDDSISVRGQSYVVTGDNDIDGNPTGGYTLDPTKYYCNFGTTLRVYAGKENVTRYAVVTVSDSSSISSPNRALHHNGTDYYYSIEFPGFSTGDIVPLGFVVVSVAVRANPICGAFSMTERIAWFITQNDKRDKKISSIDFFEEDGNGNVKLKDDYNGLWAAGFVSAGGVGSSGGGGGGIDLDRVWESLTNNTDEPNVKINLAHIPDDDRLSYVDPNAGEDITIDDPGTTGTVLWGAESANNVALDVNGVSKILVKQAALDGINSSISNLQSLVATKQDYISDLVSIRSNASLGATAYGWGDHSQEGYLKTITSQMIATALGYTPFNAASFTKANIQSTLGISDWALASSAPTYAFSDLTAHPTTLADYGITDAKFSSAGVADKIRITLGSNYHDVLTAHQSLSGYATETWVGQQGFITKAVNDLTNYYLKSQTYTQAEVNALIAAINQFHYEVYPSTSSVTDPQSNVLYLIGPTGSGSDKYEEYVYPNSTTGWTKIGDTSIDLSPYLLASVAAQTYVPLTRTVNGHALSSDVTVTKGDVGLDKVDNLAASGYFTEFANGTGSDANKVLITIGGTQKKLTVDYASNADTLDSHDSSYFGKANDVSTLQRYFTNGVANSAARLSGTSAYSIWGVEYWANGVPKSVTGRTNLYIGTPQVKA